MSICQFAAWPRGDASAGGAGLGREPGLVSRLKAIRPLRFKGREAKVQELSVHCGDHKTEWQAQRVGGQVIVASSGQVVDLSFVSPRKDTTMQAGSGFGVECFKENADS